MTQEEKQQDIVRNRPSISLMLCIILSIGLGFCYYQIQQLKNDNNESQKSAQALAYTLQQQNTQIESVKSDISAIHQQKFTLPNLWKTQYFLELAYLSNTTANGTVHTIDWLNKAKDSLSDTDANESLLGAINQDIEAVNNHAFNQSTDLLKQISTMESDIQNLPANTHHFNSISTISKAPESETWQSKILASLNTINNYIVIKRKTEVHAYPLIHTNPYILLNTLQLAIQEGDTALFKTTINALMASISFNFDANADSTKALLEKLKTMSTVSLSTYESVTLTSYALTQQLLEGQTHD